MPDVGTGGWGRGEGGRSRLNPDHGGPPYTGGLQILALRQHWYTPRRRNHQRRGVTIMVTWPRVHNAPSGKVGRRFVEKLGGDLRGVRERQWNLKRFIVFLTVMLQWDRHITASQAILQRIEKRLDTWESSRHEMVVEDTMRTCAQYLIAACREEYEDHRAQTFHSLVLQGKLQTAVEWITERGEGA